MRLTDEQISQCWIDPYKPTSRGYPQGQVHRRLCWAVWGPPPDPRLQAAHSCNNPRCVNPEHLRWATPQENAHDAVRSGHYLMHEAHPSTKLSLVQVREIRSLYKQGHRQRALGVQFGVAQCTISNIVNERTWGEPCV